MATYNFTIRATDSAGAFADQAFSLDVQRTRIDHFAALMTSPTGLVRSTDGITASTFVSEPCPLSYNAALDFANGHWIGTNVNTTDMWTSFDLINWTRRNGPTSIPNGATSLTRGQVTKYRNGRYMTFGTTNEIGKIVEWSSPDLINWTPVGYYSTPGGTVSVTDFDYDPITGTTVVGFYGSSQNGMIVRVGDGNAFQYLPYSVEIAGSISISVKFSNGLWIHHGSSQQAILISRNAQDWILRNPFQNSAVSIGGSGNVNGVSYDNGRLIAVGMANVVTNNPSNYYTVTAVSSDGGITWTSGYFSTGYQSQYMPYQVFRSIYSYGGRSLIASGSNQYLLSSTNGGISLSTIAATNMGTSSGFLSVQGRAA